MRFDFYSVCSTCNKNSNRNVNQLAVVVNQGDLLWLDDFFDMVIGFWYKG